MAANVNSFVPMRMTLLLLLRHIPHGITRSESKGVGSLLIGPDLTPDAFVLSGSSTRYYGHVKLLTEHHRVDAVGGPDDHDPCARLPPAPLVLERDVHAPADNLQYRPPLWRVGGVDHPFGPVNGPWQLTHCFPQRFQRQRLVR